MLLEEIGELERRTTSLEMALEEEAQDVGRAVTLRVGGTLGVFGLISVGAPIAILAVVFLGGLGSGSETLFGVVGRTMGAAPVSEGAPCTVFIGTIDDPEGTSYDARIEVICDGRTVYGGEDYGLLDCEWGRRYATRCTDPDFSDDGGDPKLTFTRSSGQVVIEERSPTWGLRIDLSDPRADR